MFWQFNRKVEKIDTPKTFLKCIKALRRLSLPVPLTEGYEETLRNKGQHPKKTWYTSQGEHWQGWLSEYNGGGFYGRKNHKRTAEFTYNHIMCSPMLIWIAETAGIDESIIKEAITESLKTDKYQQQCKIVRELITWSEIETAVLRKIAE